MTILEIFEIIAMATMVFAIGYAIICILYLWLRGWIMKDDFVYYLAAFACGLGLSALLSALFWYFFYAILAIIQYIVE